MKVISGSKWSRRGMSEGVQEEVETSDGCEWVSWWSEAELSETLWEMSMLYLLLQLVLVTGQGWSVHPIGPVRGRWSYIWLILSSEWLGSVCVVFCVRGECVSLVDSILHWRVYRLRIYLNIRVEDLCPVSVLKDHLGCNERWLTLLYCGWI